MDTNKPENNYEFHPSTEAVFELFGEIIDISNSLDIEEDIADIRLDDFPTFKKYLTASEIEAFTKDGSLLLFEKIEAFLKELENIPDSDKDYIFGKLENLYTKTDHFLLMLGIRVLEKRGLPQETIGKYNTLMKKVMGQ